MIKLKQCTQTGGDCTAGYDVFMDRQYVVGEFVNEILLRNGEWGYIHVFGGESVEYRYGSALSTFSEFYASQLILRAKASGGYSRMDYTLYLS